MYCAIVQYLRWGVELPVECEGASPHRPATVVARAVLALYLENIYQSDANSTGVRSGGNGFSVSGTFHDPKSNASS